MQAQQCRSGDRHQKGFSLFEIIVVVLLIGILMSMAIDRLLVLEVEAEKVSVKYVMGNLDSAVYLQAAEIVVKQGLGALKQLENRNPMMFLAQMPENYVGIKSGESASRVPTASWYFDPQIDALIYKVENKEFFESTIEGEPRIMFRLSLLYKEEGRKKTNSYIQGVRLESLHDYNWKIATE